MSPLGRRSISTSGSVTTLSNSLRPTATSILRATVCKMRARVRRMEKSKAMTTDHPDDKPDQGADTAVENDAVVDLHDEHGDGEGEHVDEKRQEPDFAEDGQQVPQLVPQPGPKTPCHSRVIPSFRG